MKSTKSFINLKSAPIKKRECMNDFARKLRLWGSAEVLLLIMSITFEGFAHAQEYLGAALPAPQSGIIFGGLIVLLAGAWVSTSQQSASHTINTSRSILVVALAWLLTSRFLHFISPAGDGWRWLTIGIFIVFCGLWWLKQPQWAILLAILLGCGIRLYLFSIKPIHPDLGDMQPLVLLALDKFTHFESPYRLYSMPWELPLTYLPITWLAYLPAFAAKSDIRLTNLIADLCIGATLYFLPAPQKQRKSLMLWWAFIFFIPIFSEYAQNATSQIFWLLLAFVLLALAHRHNGWAAIFLGLGLAASPFVAIATIFIGLYWLKHYKWQQVAAWGSMICIITLGIVLPFIIVSPNEFFFGVFQWFNDTTLYSQQVWRVGYLGTQPSISVIFWNLNLQNWLKIVQIGLLSALSLIYWRQGATLKALPTFITAAFLLFVAFNTVVWTYYYFVAFVTGLFALAYQGLKTPSQ